MQEVTAEERKRSQLRRSKAVATGILVVAAAIYAFSTWMLRNGADVEGLWGYVQAGAEAGMVGGLADWFAVTALFRRPLGLPIPHTAIIPTRKDQMGASLGEFVGSNFLADDVVRDKLRSLDIARRAGTWMGQDANAARITGELASATRGMVTVMRDDEVRNAMEHILRDRLEKVEVSPTLGRLLEQIVADGAHHPLVEVLVGRARTWVEDNRPLIMDIVGRQAPDWSPRFADELIASRIHSELLRFVTAIQENPSHQVRQSIDRMLQEVSWDLRHNPAMQQRVEGAKSALLDHPEVKAALGNLWNSAKSILIEASDDPNSALQQRVRQSISNLGNRLATDEAMQDKANRWIENAVLHVVSNYRSELTDVITDTVARWDGQETAQKIELQVGRDLQFIRINGTVVGALAGLGIHAATHLFG